MTNKSVAAAALWALTPLLIGATAVKAVDQVSLAVEHHKMCVGLETDLVAAMRTDLQSGPLADGSGQATGFAMGRLERDCGADRVFRFLDNDKQAKRLSSIPFVMGMTFRDMAEIHLG